MTSAEWHSTLFQFIGLILSLVTFIGSIVSSFAAPRRTAASKALSVVLRFFMRNQPSLLFTASGDSPPP